MVRTKTAVSLAGLLVLALIITGCFGGSSGIVPRAGRPAPEVTGRPGFPADNVQDRDLAAHAPGQMLVGVDSALRAQTIADSLNATLVRYIDMDRQGVALLEFNDPDESLTDAMRSLKGEPGVRYAEANFTEYSLPYVAGERDLVTDVSGLAGAFGVSGLGTGLLDDEDEDRPKSFYERFQYGPRITRAVEAWDQDVTGKGTIIAVIDTGVNSTHPDLAGKVLEGYNPDAPGLGTEDWHGHGTHVAATAGGYMNITAPQGTAGIAPDARILPLRVFNSDGATSASIAMALVIAADPTQVGLHSPRADVANLSLGGPVYSQAIQDAIHFASDRDVVIVASMGNSENQEISYPAAYERVIAVAATNARDEVTDFSTWGRHTSVGAPGHFVFAATPTGWAWMSGTSMAAPHVSGAVALLREERPGASPAALKDLFERTADSTEGFTRKMGHGRLNIAGALANDAQDTEQGMIELYVYDEFGFGIPGANVVLYKNGQQIRTVRTGGAFTNMFYEGVAWFFGLEPGADYSLAISLDETNHGVNKLHEVRNVQVKANDVTVERVRMVVGL